MRKIFKITDTLIIFAFNYFITGNFLFSVAFSFFIFIGIYSFRAYENNRLSYFNEQIVLTVAGTFFAFIPMLIINGIFNRFYPFKRVDRAVYLLEELKKEINNPYLLIGGMGGPMERSIKNYVEKKGLKENVKFLGQIKYDDMKDYYDCCDILLILNDYANTGNQIIESAYLGKQTIAVDDGNNSKVLNYKNIHYINYDDFLISARNEVIKIYNSKIYNFCEINNNKRISNFKNLSHYKQPHHFILSKDILS